VRVDLEADSPQNGLLVEGVVDAIDDDLRAHQLSGLTSLNIW
jgi:hypothetical protein